MLGLITDLLCKRCGQQLVLFFQQLDLGLSLLSLLLEVATLVAQSVVLALCLQISLDQIT